MTRDLFYREVISFEHQPDSIEYTGTIVDVSDRRLKKNIQDLPTGSLDKITALNGVSFEMIEGNGETELGFIAQDVEPIFPDLIRTNSEGMKSMNYIDLIAPMVESMKALQAENRNG